MSDLPSPSFLSFIVRVPRLLGIGAIKAYRLTLSSILGRQCRYLPTCSEYAYEAIARHGLWAGGWLALFRVARCGPGGTCGIDNVPERLLPRYVWFLPWRYREIGARHRDPAA